MAQLFGHEKLKVYQKGMASADPSRVEEGLELLRRIAAMLTSLSKVTTRET